jgi:hypothetical protein
LYSNIRFSIFFDELLEQHKISFRKIDEHTFYILDKDRTVRFKPSKSFEIKPDSKELVVHEDQWIFQNEIVKNRLLHFLGLNIKIPARILYVRKINKIEADFYMKDWHLLGPASYKIKYGLFIEKPRQRFIKETISNQGLILALMSFSGKRKLKDGRASYELMRFCTRPGYALLGGLSKLFNAFLKEYQPDHVMTYVDLDFGETKTYEAMGFKIQSYTEPLFFKIVGCKRVKCDSSNAEVTNRGNAKLIWEK